MKGFFAVNRLKKIIIPAAVILIIGGAVVYAITFKVFGSGNRTIVQSTAVVRKGNISTSITGSGPIQSSSSSKILSRVSSTVNAVYVKQGDTVKAGDLIMELDSSDAQASVSTAGSNLKEAMLSQEDTIDSINNLNPIASFDGQVTNITVKTGDNAGSNSPIMTVSDTSKLKIVLSFSAVDIKGIAAGSDVSVNVPDIMDTVNGKVSSISDLPYTTSQGGSLYNVTIEIDNPGSLKEGMKANADINTSNGTASSIDTGTLSYINKQLVRTPGGTVKDVYVVENQCVKAGTPLASIENKDVLLSKSTSDLKIENLQNQLKIANEQLDSCKITAPFDGVISKLNVKVGDDINAGAELADIFDDKSMEFDVSVDELDIQKIEVGQEADVTLDAIEETSLKPLSGKVSEISIQGTSSSGVTTYPVTISIDDPQNLKIGMNANAEIFLLNKQDVLYVPLEAVQKIGGKSYVMVKSDEAAVEKMKEDGTYPDVFKSSASSGQGSGRQSSTRSTGSTGSTGNTKNTGSSSSSQKTASSTSNNITAQNADYYNDAIPTLVETGVNNESYIEITSGLKEGDVIILPASSTTQNSSTGQNQNDLGGMGGALGGDMGGGMPPGDMPQGGPPSGGGN